MQVFSRLRNLLPGKKTVITIAEWEGEEQEVIVLCVQDPMETGGCEAVHGGAAEEIAHEPN